jgi:ATP-binding cassette, subfamily B (MDR/TAP), member 1
MAETAVANGAGSGSGDAAGNGKKTVDKAVSFHELFSFADKWDLLLMAVGSLGALVHGAAMPFCFLVFGRLINSFGKNPTDLRTMNDEVAKVCSSLFTHSVLPLFSAMKFASPRSPVGFAAAQQCLGR